MMMVMVVVVTMTITDEVDVSWFTFSCGTTFATSIWTRSSECERRRGRGYQSSDATPS